MEHILESTVRYILLHGFVHTYVLLELRVLVLEHLITYLCITGGGVAELSSSLTRVINYDYRGLR